jgi:dipeptidyl aminopeptidase/acylaminoacyl peptidase
VRPATLRYGADRAQVAEVWQPEDAAGALPVVVLIHGGFWHQHFTKRLMHRLARAVTGQGWIAYNIEYRRIGPFGGGGWPRTFEDVSDAIDALDRVEAVDRGRVATCGHSAGGQLALWAASARATGDSRRPPPAVDVCAAVSLAGVVDLGAAARQLLGRGAVQSLMGGDPDDVPDRYRLGSPTSLLPIGKPQLLLHGVPDRSVPPALSEHYVETAVSLGDPARFVSLPGVGHLEMISGRGTPFRELTAWLDSVFGGATS